MIPTENRNLQLDRVEITKKVFNSKGFCIEERLEYWYPEQRSPERIGFKLNSLLHNPTSMKGKSPKKAAKKAPKKMPMKKGK